MAEGEALFILKLMLVGDGGAWMMVAGTGRPGGGECGDDYDLQSCCSHEEVRGKGEPRGGSLSGEVSTDLHSTVTFFHHKKIKSVHKRNHDTFLVLHLGLKLHKKYRWKTKMGPRNDDSTFIVPGRGHGEISARGGNLGLQEEVGVLAAGSWGSLTDMVKHTVPVLKEVIDQEGFDRPLVEKSGTAMEVGFVHFYRKPYHQEFETMVLLRKLKAKSAPQIAFPTAFSTNAVTICQSVSLVEVIWLERSRRYLLCLKPGSDPLDERQLSDFAALVHDRMTELAPYPGAEKSVGGRIRHTHDTGKGSFIAASTAGYCVGNFQIDDVPGEDPSLPYPSNLASPLQILIEVSDGASNYGGTFGDPEIGMLVVKIGGPAHRVGIGGVAASSMISDQSYAKLGLNALPSGDAEMAHKLYRVVRTCAEMGDNNPIISFDDQGSEGNCNVLKKLIYRDAETNICSISDKDRASSSVMETLGAEYQEQSTLFVKSGGRTLLESLCERERIPMAVIGEVNGCGTLLLSDSVSMVHAKLNGLPPPTPIEELELDKRVLRLLSVCSKRFLTPKVDRTVTGLVAHQQTVGPLQLPLADVAVIAQTYTDLTGVACSIGEQPIKGLLNPKAMARLALGEALTNLVWAKVTSFSDVKASANWIYANTLNGHCVNDATVAFADCMSELGIIIDGERDSFSMGCQCGGEVVKAPGNLVISTYVTCPDITLSVTPDFKLGNYGVLLQIDIGKGKRRLGGSALAQAFDQIGNECPDIDDVSYLRKAFKGVQELLNQRIISAGHDISDGGLIVCALEMAFAGNCGIKLDINSEDASNLFEALFAEEIGLVIEVHSKNLNFVKQKLETRDVSTSVIENVTTSPEIEVVVDGKLHLKERTWYLRDLWEETSFKLEELQSLPACVKLEKGLKSRTSPSWSLSFTPKFTKEELFVASSKPKVAIIREEGSNGDREMAAAFYAAGFEPWDVTMSDLLAGKSSLAEFRGVAFVGGSSYADVLDSAKGWAASIRFNHLLRHQFLDFYHRPDTFSLGVCNGCQLMALLGWIPGPDVGGSLDKGGDMSQPRFVHNESGRFECRFISVYIRDYPAIMLKGMEGSTLGMWSAYAKGRAYFPDESVLDNVVKFNLAPVLYCDDANNITETYPFNPSGSPLGIAALCSPDGRHLAMMPHPERSFMMWQYPCSNLKLWHEPPSVLASCVQHDGPGRDDSSDLLAAPARAKPPRGHVLAPCALAATKAITSTSSTAHVRWIELGRLARTPMASTQRAVTRDLLLEITEIANANR
ncbi:hypothetical protein PR202_ga13229 [Eleusine coracana subsp. coracana]|uniref:Formylglycinamide ribotide amidotransferase n=1 Tax=Eleusine coracana subsp. coracana TaxID=191504 RepID=A0AAV5CED7_ELECO|nr:hypothetical protein PR202_ga13229 [Eleusine coracana subsp. coracana]